MTRRQEVLYYVEKFQNKRSIEHVPFEIGIKIPYNNSLEPNWIYLIKQLFLPDFNWTDKSTIEICYTGIKRIIKPNFHKFSHIVHLGDPLLLYPFAIINITSNESFENELGLIGDKIYLPEK